jgi:hypothetical protein
MCFIYTASIAARWHPEDTKAYYTTLDSLTATDGLKTKPVLCPGVEIKSSSRS